MSSDPITLRAGSHKDTRRGGEPCENLVFPLVQRDGFAFALLCVRGKAGQEILSGLIASHLDRLAESIEPRANAEHRFERFLSELNGAIADGVRGGSWTVPIDGFRAMVGLAAGRKLFLSGTGGIAASYVHREESTQRYRTFDLARNLSLEQMLPSWEKTFAVVLDGELHDGDALCLASTDLEARVDPGDLQEILSALPPKGAAAKIRQHFSARARVDVLVLQACRPGIASEKAAMPRTELSVAQMQETERETAETLADKRPNPLSLIRKLGRRRKDPTRPDQSDGPGASERLKRSASRLASRMASGAVAVFGLGKWRGGSEGVIETTEAPGRKLLSRIARHSKPLLAASLLLVIAFVTSVYFLSSSKEKQQVVAAYEAELAEARDRADRAAGAIIFKDEPLARTLFAEATELAEALPQESDDQRANKQAILADIAEGMNQLRHIVDIEDPPVAGTLEGADGQALVRLETGIVVLGSDKRAHRLVSEERRLAPIEAASGEIGSPIAATAHGSGALFLDDRPGISRLDDANALLQVTGLAPAEGGRWTDIEAFGSRVYALQPGADGQVIRFNPTAFGFDAGSRWIQSRDMDLTRAASLAIDGTIFILSEDGTIGRFDRGAQIAWSAGLVDPPVSAATRIWTSADSSYVYVLEPANKRLVVYKKDNGEFLQQYRSDAFENLADMLVDEASRTIYFLSGPTLYAIEASHL